MGRSPGQQRLHDMELNEIKRKCPNNPYPESFVPKYKENNANSLTRAIIKFLQLHGHQAERISVTGRRIDKRKIVYDVLGHARQVGSVEWIKSSMQPGTADISATIRGRSVKIEVKVGRDKQREAQVLYQQQIERAGGVYMIATSLDQFMEWYDNFIGEAQHG